MKYRAIYYNPGEPGGHVFGMFDKKAEAISSIKSRFGKHDFVHDFTAAKVERIADGFPVYAVANRGQLPALRRARFSVLFRAAGEAYTVETNGYQDGAYNYYSTGNTWQCIDPESGLPVVGPEHDLIWLQITAHETAPHIARVKQTAEYRAAADMFRRLTA